ncbi:hypothetical protein [Thermofilum pendens]|nr:hypothetical protein [Thermofilum pendens]
MVSWMYWYYYFPGGWYPPYWYPVPYPDPVSLMYAWSYMWSYWLSTIYYIEMYKAMLEAWRKMVEATFKAPVVPTG